MESIMAVLERFVARGDCEFDPPAGAPALPPDLQLPEDLAAFYRSFREARLLVDSSDPRYRIMRPTDFVQIGVRVFGEPTRGIQRTWYAAVDVLDGNYFAVDLSPHRLGWFYDCFHEDIAPASCRVIAHAFTELMNLISAAGNEAWWIAPGFEGYGYARNRDEERLDDWAPQSW